MSLPSTTDRDIEQGYLSWSGLADGSQKPFENIPITGHVKGEHILPLSENLDLPAELQLAEHVVVIDYDGPDDKRNPFTWPESKKWYCIFVIGAMCTVNNIGASIISIGIPDIVHDYHSTRIPVTLGLALYVLGLGIGPIVASSLSEEFGRKHIYIVAYTCFIFIQFPCALGPPKVNFVGWLICRFLAGCFASPGPAVGSGTIADLYPPKVRAFPSLVFVCCAFCGPALGPVLSGLLVQHVNWRWTVWTTMILAALLFPFILFMPETYKTTILDQDVMRRQINGEMVIRPVKEKFGVMIKVALLRPIKLLITEPIILLFSIYSGFVYALLYGFTSSLPYVYQHVYGFTLAQSGLPFLATCFGVISAIPIYMIFFEPIYQKQIAPVKPEARLPPMIAGAVALSVSLFFFGWTAGLGIHFAVPIVASGIFGYSALALFLPQITYIMDSFPAVAASASGANGLVRYTMGFIFPLISRLMLEHLGIKWAMTLLGGISILMLPMPFVFMRWGQAVRVKGKYHREEVVGKTKN